MRSHTLIAKLVDILKILKQNKEKINLIFSSYLTQLPSFRSAEKLWKTSRNVTISLWEGQHGWTPLLRETNSQTDTNKLPAAKPWRGNVNSLLVSAVRVSRIWLQHHQWQNSASLDQLPQEVSKCQCKYTLSPTWHTAGASCKTQHQAVQAPFAAKHTLKHLQVNPSPVEVGSSDRDPSTSSSPC